MSNDLKAFSDVFDEQLSERQIQLRLHQKVLGEPLIFKPSEDAPGHGIGWFKIGNEFRSYCKYSNGYELYPTHVIPVEMIKDLSKFI